MKTFAPKAILSILATSMIVSGLVYAATVSTVTNQTINSGDVIGQGWFQSVNDKVNGLSQGWTCSLSEYQLRYQGCPAGSVVYRVNDVCGEWSCGGSLTSGNACRYFDGTHIGQTDATSCY